MMMLRASYHLFRHAHEYEVDAYEEYTPYNASSMGRVAHASAHTTFRVSSAQKYTLLAIRKATTGDRYRPAAFQLAKRLIFGRYGPSRCTTSRQRADAEALAYARYITVEADMRHIQFILRQSDIYLREEPSRQPLPGIASHATLCRHGRRHRHTIMSTSLLGDLSARFLMRA